MSRRRSVIMSIFKKYIHLFSFKWNAKGLFNDCCSKYMGPAYHHDRCERSLHMHLYVMQKSEIMLTIVTFISLFVLCLFIGLAGPNSVRLDPVLATKMLEQQRQQQQSIETNPHNHDGYHRSSSLFSVKALMNERYYIMTPLVSSYCQQLNLWIKFDLANSTDVLPNFSVSKTGKDVLINSHATPVLNRINQMSEILSDIQNVKSSDPIIFYIENNQSVDNSGNGDSGGTGRTGGIGGIGDNIDDMGISIQKTDQNLKNVPGILKRSIQLESTSSIGRSHRSQRNKEQVNGMTGAEEEDPMPAKQLDLHNLPISIYLTVEAFEESDSATGKSEAHSSVINSKSPFPSPHRRSNHSIDGEKSRITQSHQKLPSEYLSGKIITIRRNLTCNYNPNGHQTSLLLISNSGVSQAAGSGGGGLECRPIEMMHLSKLDYASYKFGIYFSNETIDKISKLAISHRVELREIIFTLQSINTSFTILIIWFRFVLLLLSIATTCFFVTCLYKYPIRDWSMEQRWTTILLVLLIASNNPLFPMRLIFDSVLPKLLDNMFDSIFTGSLCLYWLCFSHGIRQTNRDIITFYLPKLLLVCSLWSITLYGSIWSIYNRSFEPTSDQQRIYQDSAPFQLMNVLFHLILAIYLAYLVYLFSVAMAELRFMSFLDIRLKIQTFFCSFVLLVYASIIWLNQSNGDNDEEVIISGAWSQYPPLLRLVPLNYKISSAGACLSYHALNNLYLITCAYLYYPHIRSLPQSPLAEENSSLSIFKEDFCTGAGSVEDDDEEDDRDEEEDGSGNNDEEEIVYDLENVGSTTATKSANRQF